MAAESLISAEVVISAARERFVGYGVIEAVNLAPVPGDVCPGGHIRPQNVAHESSTTYRLTSHNGL
ncbi:hypothetical protein [Amycolatopsis keratiniphila]|uniref:Uncharacterized protein n=1 Tax=Amycolatopsis keratiniphila TaxID=129921 RepID=R4T5M4_9PSEU|nr:hypothetical protein [Amycolatopsis keratiniphila]AGM05928.1 hypothetical protein AORI_3343 [Amycolatopsis keratiniphila]